MELIKELTVTVAAEPEQAPRCMVNHSVPAVFFSTGGFVGNYFHDFTDVIIPLFMTSRRFNGEVQLVVTDFNHQFMDKYQQILKQLSSYPAINLDADDRVHCFPHAHLGLFSHRALGIDSSKSPDGISMTDFRSFLRKPFSLRRAYIFGEPAPDMGVRYVEFEIRMEESTLVEQFPRDHEVFRDPISIQKQQGFNEFWNIFLNKQKVKLDVRRFRSTLSQVLHSIRYHK
ncbi:hypothetical protein GW17_00007442 [Ensete ventricosum]|nr:hypothetical protein GW17_00007442 [Ensete ventricosum]